MTPYELQQAIDKADENASKSNFADKAVITETFLLVRRLAQHAADVEAERRLALSNTEYES
jgi:hypothetical protein